ncbi:valine--tRNA ligase [Candidatus Saccharibacteria bacterium]|nr:MAG: valine--tRNA ligase [Candidatus Saccharibacteria bacterium]
MNLPKTYEPGQYENDIYALWEKSGAFQPQGSGDAYSIVMPPPNANANLHIGYELTVALEDIPARYHRMLGKPTLLLPGADHAGFETQSVYEKHLAKEGKSRFDFTREELYSQMYDFVAKNRHNFENQLRRMGVSCDWTHYTFTLDEKIVSQAYKTFKKMWDEGLIYRGERLVNFCTFHGTAFADVEVEHKEEPGKLWHIRYPLTNGSGEVVVATTRPETMLGDTGVAVHPEDARYTKFVGKTARLPLTGREVPIVADDFVDKEYGTGAVKLTPAHDPNDYEAAARHSLPKISIITHEGKISHEAPEKYRGLTVKEAREQVVKDLEAEGFLVKTEELSHNVGHCYKCGTVIEPLLKDQWFVDMQPLAKPAIAALKANKIKFYPETKKDQLIGYLEGLRDWNISRQIAWGIPIPAFQNVDEPDDWVFDERVDQEILTIGDKTYHRDPDVFDTWFSSSSWPYATLGLEGNDFKQFYPLSLMETGGEILYPWVSRMIMLGLYITGDIPFREVYIHGYVMAEDGSKMSKSIGNVVDPLPVIEQYGSDALRMGIIAGRSPAVNRGYDPRRVEEARNFCNKLWNIARYTEGVLGDAYKPGTTPDPQTIADHWVLHELQQSTKTISKFLDEYRFSEAYEHLYHFVWDNVADWYVEASKGQEGREVLGYVLEQMLKLAHPFAPFVTETIWQTLYKDTDSLLVTEKWPKIHRSDSKLAAEFTEIQTIVTEARGLIKDLGLSKPQLFFTEVPFIANNKDILKRLAGIDKITEVSDGDGLFLTSTKYRCWLEVNASTLHAYTEKLTGQLADTEKTIAQLQGRLDNKSYVDNAPKRLVDETRQQLTDAQASLERIRAEHERFSSM